MPSLELRTTKLANTKERDECVLLIESAQDDATRILDELGSARNERFRMKQVTEVSSGIERSRRGGVAAVVLDLTLPAGHDVEMFDKSFKAAPRGPIFSPSGADREEMARQAIHRDARNYLVNHPAGGCRLRQRCTQ